MRPRMGWGQRAVVALLLTVVIVPPLAGFYSYFSGVPCICSRPERRREKEASARPPPPSVSLVSGQAHTLEVPDEVATDLGNPQGEHDSVAVAQAPTTMRPLVLPGSTGSIPLASPASALDSLRPEWSSSPRSGILSARPARRVPRAEAGRQRLEGRSPGGFLQCGRGLQEERSPGCPGATGAGPEDSRRRRETCASGPGSLYAHCRACRAGRPQRRSTGPSTTSSCGTFPRTRSTLFMPRPRKSVPTRTRGSRPRRAGG